jgi:hypothetical protein
LPELFETDSQYMYFTIYTAFRNALDDLQIEPNSCVGWMTTTRAPPVIRAMPLALQPSACGGGGQCSAVRCVVWRL